MGLNLLKEPEIEEADHSKEEGLLKEEDLLTEASHTPEEEKTIILVMKANMKEIEGFNAEGVNVKNAGSKKKISEE